VLCVVLQQPSVTLQTKRNHLGLLLTYAHIKFYIGVGGLPWWV
jgi:hypothetical protein